jgi:hypothetical protein
MASMEMAESVQHAITPAECKDFYYPGDGNTDAQCFPTLVDNRYYFSLQSFNQGATNTIIFNPDQGLSDIVLTAVLPAPTGSSGSGSWAGYALPRYWLGAMIDQVALRIGGSSLYFFTGDQILIDTLTDCEDGAKKQAVFNLGGGEMLQPSDYNNQQYRSASIYLKMPFNSISALQKTLPLNTDLLTQPVQILVQFKRFADVAYWYGSGAPQPSNLPSAFQNVEVNFRKTTLQNSEQLLARREDMMSKALTIPLRYFSQTTFRTNLVGTTALQPVTINLTGFRSGSVKYIDIWATPLAGGTVPPGQNWNFSQFAQVQLLINGLVMYDSRNFNNALWSLCERKTPTQVDTTVLSSAPDNSQAIATPSTMPWLTIPFAQLCEPGCFENDVALGYPIQNSVINLTVSFPGSGDYTLCAAYHYAASLVATKNTMEYVF